MPALSAPSVAPAVAEALLNPAVPAVSLELLLAPSSLTLAPSVADVLPPMQPGAALLPAPAAIADVPLLS